MNKFLEGLSEMKNLKVEEAGTWPLLPKLLVYLLLAGLGLLLVFYLLVKPDLAQIDRVKKETQEIEQEIEYQLTKLSNFDQQQDLLVELTKRLVKANLVLPDEQEQPELIDTIAKNALKAKLQLDEFRPLPEIESDQFFELPIQLVFEGGYHSVGEFMASVSSMERLVIPTKVELVKSKADQEQGMLAGKVVLRTYRFKERLENLEVKQAEKKQS